MVQKQAWSSWAGLGCEYRPLSWVRPEKPTTAVVLYRPQAKVQNSEGEHWRDGKRDKGEGSMRGTAASSTAVKEDMQVEVNEMLVEGHKPMMVPSEVGEGLQTADIR